MPRLASWLALGAILSPLGVSAQPKLAPEAVIAPIGPPAIFISSVQTVLVPPWWTISLTNAPLTNQVGWVCRQADGLGNAVSRRNAFLDESQVTFNKVLEGLNVVTVAAKMQDFSEIPVFTNTWNVAKVDSVTLLVVTTPGTYYWVYQSPRPMGTNWQLTPGRIYDRNVALSLTNAYVVQNPHVDGASWYFRAVTSTN